VYFVCSRADLRADIPSFRFSCGIVIVREANVSRAGRKIRRARARGRNLHVSIIVDSSRASSRSACVIINNRKIEARINNSRRLSAFTARASNSALCRKHPISDASYFICRSRSAASNVVRKKCRINRITIRNTVPRAARERERRKQESISNRSRIRAARGCISISCAQRYCNSNAVCCFLRRGCKRSRIRLAVMARDQWKSRDVPTPIGLAYNFCCRFSR